MGSAALFKSFGPFFSAGVLVTAPKVYHYLVGTTTLKNAWTDRAKTTTAAQPIVGDANGIVSAYFDGLYKIVVKDSSDVTLYTWDNFDISGSGLDLRNVKTDGAIGDGTTSDQTELEATIATAFADGMAVFWPDGTYLTTATIPNFHDVEHQGPGVVKRGSDLFYITQTSSAHANDLYVSTSGADTNDGLSASQPIRTVQHACDIVEHWKPLRYGWTVSLAAGTYAEAVSLKSNVSFNDNYLTFKGPTVTKGTAVSATTNAAGYATGTTTVTLASAGSGTILAGDMVRFTGDTALYLITSGDADVSNGGTITFYPGLEVAIPASATAITVATTNSYTPTAIIDYPGSGSVGLDIQQHNKVKVQDIKFTDWMGSAVTGVNADDDSTLWTVNVHCAYCRQGIVGNNCRLYVQGGLLHGVDWTTGAFPAGGGSVGIVAYAGTLATVGYNATNYDTGTFIENFAQSGYEGKSRTHVLSSWCTYRSNEIAVWLYTHGRFDDRTNTFKKNELVYLSQGGFISRDELNGTSDYNFGETYTQAPADVGSGNFQMGHFFQHSSEELFYHLNGISGLDICHQRQSTLQTGTIASTLTRTLCTIPAGQLDRSSSGASDGKYIDVFLTGATAGAVGTKTVVLQMGSTAITTLTIASGTVTWSARVVIWASNTTSVVQFTEATNATITAVRGTPSVDCLADQDLDVYTAIPGAADTATLHETRAVMWG